MSDTIFNRYTMNDTINNRDKMGDTINNREHISMSVKCIFWQIFKEIVENKYLYWKFSKKKCE